MQYRTYLKFVSVVAVVFVAKSSCATYPVNDGAANAMLGQIYGQMLSLATDSNLTASTNKIIRELEGLRADLKPGAKVGGLSTIADFNKTTGVDKPVVDCEATGLHPSKRLIDAACTNYNADIAALFQATADYVVEMKKYQDATASIFRSVPTTAGGAQMAQVELLAIQNGQTNVTGTYTAALELFKVRINVFRDALSKANGLKMFGVR